MSLLVLVSAPRGFADMTNYAPLTVWDTTVRVTTGGGYRDNALRTSIAPEGGAFFNSSADATFIRLADSGAQLTIFLLGEDTRYFDLPSVDYEQLFSGSVRGVLPVGGKDELGGQFNYFYQHQILDVSETETTLRRVLVDGNGLTFHPSWKHALGRGWSAQLEGTALRQFYGGDLDDFWEAGGRLSVIRVYGNRSEFSFGYLSRHLLYDSRERFDRLGVNLPGTSLVYWQQEIGGEWRHNWDKARHWRTASKASWMSNRDNGSGYFNYDRVLFRQQLRWTYRQWEIKANARFGWYGYDVQLVDGGKRERAYASLDMRVERRLGKYWLLYATAEREWNTSNDPLDEYNDWMAGAGVGIEF